MKTEWCSDKIALTDTRVTFQTTDVVVRNSELNFHSDGLLVSVYRC
jgi:hypothetical protein